MKKSVESEIDLLKDRRKDFGLKSPIGTSTHELRKKGMLIGSIFIAIGLIGSIIVKFYNTRLEKRRTEATEQAKEYDRLKSKFEQEIIE